MRKAKQDLMRVGEPDIQSRILTIRGVQVMLDRDLAELYGVEVKRLNEQVNRNIERFPERFMHQLTQQEFADLKLQIATSSLNASESRLKSQFATSSWGGVAVEIVTSRRGNGLSASDVEKFNAQYGGLTVRASAAFHDRFLVVDNQRLYLFGASLKDLGKKCFAFTKLDAAEIPRIVERCRNS